MFAMKLRKSSSLGMRVVAGMMMWTGMAAADEFVSDFGGTPDRVWAGESYWANRLQDWRVHQHRLESVVDRPLPMRTVHLLTHRLRAETGSVDLSVRSGVVGDAQMAESSARGFLIGVGHGKMDHRAAALVHGRSGPGAGLFVGVDGGGRVFIRDFEAPPPSAESEASAHDGKTVPREIDLRVRLQPDGVGYQLTVSSHDPVTGRMLQEASQSGIAPERVAGTVALVGHPGPSETRYWYRDWRLAGSKVQAFPDDTCGPIIGAQHTLSRGVMKLTAQLMPIGDTEPQRVELMIQRAGQWTTVATADVVLPGWTAPFRIADWNDQVDTPYQVMWNEHAWSGTIRRDPVDKPTLVVAGFTGNHNNSRSVAGGRDAMEPATQGNWMTDLWFPHADLVRATTHHQPDVLFFSGDQVYEGSSPTFPDIRNIQLDYLYKWYLWCWAYRDLTRDIPTVTLPDDHDVYQGNVWGQGGRKAPKGQNSGGYVHSAEFVKMVDRTQTSHLPDPFDPTPVDQGIGVYYTAMTYGRVGFAVIEDRKFKSGCEGPGLPSLKGSRSDHVVTEDPAVLDVPGLTLLGDRQLDFLHEFAGNWRGQDMKMCLSQTIFANVATHHGGMQWMTADMDSNGWPQTGRNKAVDALRRGFVFHLAGDQHLATVVHHGIEQHGDAMWSMCVPSIANFYPRAWAPLLGPTDRYHPPALADYTGDRRDGFGHPVTVYAATNPGHSMGHEPAALHDGMPGYGIVRMNKLDRTITLECWPRFADPARDAQYVGWPITIQQTDNYGRAAVAYLPTLEIQGLAHPVVQLIDEDRDEVVYTLRIQGHRFRPKVFKPGAYTIKVGDPDTNQWQTLPGVVALPPDQDQSLPVSFAPGS